MGTTSWHRRAYVFLPATLLSALFSKSVEITFATVFVSLLGQLLSRRAIEKRSKRPGISIAEMTMRSWITQPGTLLAQWMAVRYAALTLLGGIALVSSGSRHNVSIQLRRKLSYPPKLKVWSDREPHARGAKVTPASFGQF